MSRDEQDPKTRILGTIALAPRQGAPRQPLRDPEKTQLGIAPPAIASVEPDTKIVDPNTLRSALSRVTPTSPAVPQLCPHEEITVPRPRAAIVSQDANTVPGPQRRTMPFVLAVMLAAACLAAGASLLRPRASGANAAVAVQPNAGPATAVGATPATSPVTAITAKPAARPIATVLEPNVPVEASVVAELERRAVDHLRDNDHRGALALYRELTRVADAQPAYPVMVSLLERRLRECQGGPGCAR